MKASYVIYVKCVTHLIQFVEITKIFFSSLVSDVSQLSICPSRVNTFCIFEDRKGSNNSKNGQYRSKNLHIYSITDTPDSICIFFFQLYLTFHSYGQYILYPWGYARRDTPDKADLQKLGNIGANAVRQLSGRKYSVGTAAKMLYPAAGKLSICKKVLNRSKIAQVQKIYLKRSHNRQKSA